MTNPQALSQTESTHYVSKICNSNMLTAGSYKIQ